MEKKIFLDFDGVLFDSVNEGCLLTFQAKHGVAPLGLIGSEYNKRFRQYRYLTKPTWQYFYLDRGICESFYDINFDIEKYFYRKINDEFAYEASKSFHEKYYQLRHEMMELDIEEWLDFFIPYPFLKHVAPLLRRFHKNFVILTYKNKGPVTVLLNRHIGSSDVEIIDKDALKDTSKAEVIKKYMDAHEIESAIFVDDSKDLLEECEGIKNLELIQPNWGYIEPQKNFYRMPENEVIAEICSFLSE